MTKKNSNAALVYSFLYKIVEVSASVQLCPNSVFLFKCSKKCLEEHWIINVGVAIVFLILCFWMPTYCQQSLVIAPRSCLCGMSFMFLLRSLGFHGVFQGTGGGEHPGQLCDCVWTHGWGDGLWLPPDHRKQDLAGVSTVLWWCGTASETLGVHSSFVFCCHLPLPFHTSLIAKLPITQFWCWQSALPSRRCIQ